MIYYIYAFKDNVLLSTSQTDDYGMAETIINRYKGQGYLIKLRRLHNGT